MEEKIKLTKLSGLFKIKRIKKKTASAAFKSFKAGDVMLVSYSPAQDIWYISKILDTGEEVHCGCPSQSVLRRILGYDPSFELEELTTSALTAIDDFCKSACLVGPGENCEICPLRNFKSK